MSSTSKTAKLQLNQWARTDGVCMDDFNADNAKIDAALAAIKIPIEKLLEVTTAQDAAAVELDLSGIDLSIYRSLQVEITGTGAGISSDNTTDFLYLRINKTSTGYGNGNASSPSALATLSLPRNYNPNNHPAIMRGKIDITWSDTDCGYDIMLAQGSQALRYPGGNVTVNTSAPIAYDNLGGISDLDTIDIAVVSRTSGLTALVQAGAKFVVYGVRA